MDSILQSYNPIGLAEMTEKSLLGRIDIKYIIKSADVASLLHNAIEGYDILEINGQRNTAYETIYYDNPDYDLYHNARLKRPNRFKIRYRQYKVNGQEFFELKKKVRGTTTLKERLTLESGSAYTQQIKSFLQQYNIIDTQYKQSLQVWYDRICLVSKSNNERVTIDTNIKVNDFKHNFLFKGLAIVEIKSKKNSVKNQVTYALNQLGYHPTSSSKYCLGLAFVDPDLNRSGFAHQIKVINSILQLQNN